MRSIWMGWKHSAPEQTLSLLRGVEVLVASRKAMDQACREASLVGQTNYRWHKEYGGVEADRAK